MYMPIILFNNLSLKLFKKFHLIYILCIQYKSTYKSFYKIKFIIFNSIKKNAGKHYNENQQNIIISEYKI